MGTNPLGKGTKNVSVNMAEELRDELAKLADASGLTLSAYIKTVLADAVKDGATITTRIEKGQPSK
jgi:predicted DNA-binding protein